MVSRKVRAHLVCVPTQLLSQTPTNPRDLGLESGLYVTFDLFRSCPFGVRENTGYDHIHHGSAIGTRIIRLVKGSAGVVDTGEWRVRWGQSDRGRRG